MAGRRPRGLTSFMKNDRSGAARAQRGAVPGAGRDAPARAASRAGAEHERRLYREAQRRGAQRASPAASRAPSASDTDRGGADPIHRLLGDLETEIMAIMWRRGEATVRDVLGDLASRRELAYTTVMTVMARLAEKGLLRRRLQGKAHWYEVAQSRDEFLRNTSQRLVRSLIEEFGDVAMAAMLQEMEQDIARVDPDRLERLRRLAEGAPPSQPEPPSRPAARSRAPRG